MSLRHDAHRGLPHALRATGLFLALMLNAGLAQAGPYTDDLSKCLVASTTTADKNALVKWMFATAALHPAVKSIASITPAERDAFTRSTAHLFERLLTESCRAPAQQAMKYEGAMALQTGFQMLGQVAARELFADPSVAGGLAEFGSHLNGQKLQQLLGGDQ